MSSSLARESGVYSLGSILRRGFGFFLIPIYTRFLSVEEYGMLSLLNLMLQLLYFVFLFGISSGAIRFYFNPNSDESFRKEVYGNALILLFILPFMLFLSLTPLTYFLTNRFLPSIPFFPYIFLVMLIGLLWPIKQLLLGLFRAQQRAKLFVIFTVSLFLVQTAMIVIAVVWMKRGLKGLLLAQLIANLVFWLIAIKTLKKSSKFSFSWNISKQLIKFGIPLMPFFIFSWINTASGRFLLDRYTSIRDVGIFALAAQFSGLLGIFGLAFSNAALPYFYQAAQRPRASEDLGRFATKYFTLFGLISLFTVMCARPAILIMADSKFHEAISYVPLLILASLFSLIYQYFHWNFLYCKRTGLSSLLTGISAFLMVAFLILSLEQWEMGIWGVILTLNIVNFVTIIVGYFISQKQLKINYKLKDISINFLVILVSAFIIDNVSFGGSVISSILIKLLIFSSAAIFIINRAKIEVFKKLTSLRTYRNKLSNIKSIYKQNF